MSEVMMQLGNFQFSVPEAAYQKLSRVTQFNWASIDRINDTPVRQFTGKKADTLSMTGVIYPQQGGGETLDALRIMGHEGVPYCLVDGLGIHHGFWVIESIGDDRSIFAKQGKAKRIDFSVKLSFYGWQFL